MVFTFYNGCSHQCYGGSVNTALRILYMYVYRVNLYRLYGSVYIT